MNNRKKQSNPQTVVSFVICQFNLLPSFDALKVMFLICKGFQSSKHYQNKNYEYRVKRPATNISVQISVWQTLNTISAHTYARTLLWSSLLSSPSYFSSFSYCFVTNQCMWNNNTMKTKIWQLTVHTEYTAMRLHHIKIDHTLCLSFNALQCHQNNTNYWDFEWLQIYWRRIFLPTQQKNLFWLFYFFKKSILFSCVPFHFILFGHLLKFLF